MKAWGVLRKLPWCLVVLILGAASSGAAQSVRGRVLEAETGRPVSEAQVTLVTPNGLAAGVAFSNPDGQFLIKAPRSGRYILQIRRLGFQARADAVDVGAGELVLEYRLAAVPVTLDPVTIEAEVNARYLDLVGFYQRQRADFGHFITRDKIEARRAARVSDVLQVVPGVRLLPDSRAVGARVRVQLRSALDQRGAVCEPRVFIDGLVAIRGDSRPTSAVFNESAFEDLGAEDPRAPDPAVDDVVDPLDIEAIEVYRSGAEVPAHFGGMSPYTRCGVIVIWTRRGR